MMRFANGTFMAKAFHAALFRQWFEVLNYKTPLLEYAINLDGVVDYFDVHVRWSDNGLVFEFDQSFPVWFDGSIIKESDGVYTIPFDRYFDNLDYYLQAINDNIVEGYIIPNGLMIK